MLLCCDYWGMCMKSSAFRIILNNPKFLSSLHLLTSLLTSMGRISYSARSIWKTNKSWSMVGLFCYISSLMFCWFYYLHETEVDSSALNFSACLSQKAFHLGNASIFRIKTLRERVRLMRQRQWSQHDFKRGIIFRLSLAIPKYAYLFLQNENVEFNSP